VTNDLDGVASYTLTLPINTPTTSALEIHGSVRIEQNGTVHLAPGVTLDEASEQFWHKIAAALPGLFVSRETYSQAASRLSEMDAENKKLRELLAEALEALTPFASDADLWSGSDSLSLVEAAPGYSDALNVGDLRRARAAADKIRAGVKEGNVDA